MKMRYQNLPWIPCLLTSLGGSRTRMASRTPARTGTCRGAGAGERPLVLRAEPDLAGHPLREREGHNFLVVRFQQVLVYHVRGNRVPHHPDPYRPRVAFLECNEVWPGDGFSVFSCTKKPIFFANFFASRMAPRGRGPRVILPVYICWRLKGLWSGGLKK